MSLDHELRRKGVGSSDIAPILGLSTYATPLDIWRDKILGPDLEPDDNRRKWGRLLEPLVRQQAAEALGTTIEVPAPLERDDWMRANLDGLTAAGDVVEIKTAGVDQAAEWGEPGTDDVPESYLAQVAWQLAVAGRSLAHVAVLIGGNDFRMYRIPRNLELERAILDRCHSFWFENVKRQVPPENVSLADARKRWRHEIAGKVVKATPEILERLDAKVMLENGRSGLIKDIERINFRLAEFMGDAEAIVRDDGSPLLTWKLQKRKGYTVEPSEARVMRTTKWLTQLLGNQTTKEIEA